MWRRNMSLYIVPKGHHPHCDIYFDEVIQNRNASLYVSQDRYHPPLYQICWKADPVQWFSGQTMRINGSNKLHSNKTRDHLPAAKSKRALRCHQPWQSAKTSSYQLSWEWWRSFPEDTWLHPWCCFNCALNITATPSCAPCPHSIPRRPSDPGGHCHWKCRDQRGAPSFCWGCACMFLHIGLRHWYQYNQVSSSARYLQPTQTYCWKYPYSLLVAPNITIVI